MKTKIFVFLVMLLSMCAALPAQNKKADQRVQLAREKYPVRLEQIAYVKGFEEDGTPNVNYLSTVRKQNWAGSGQSVDKAEYYYREIEDEYEPAPIGYVLLMVRRTYNMGSQNVFEEYVYDDDGHPLFWFAKYGWGNEAPTELRGYYDADGSQVRVISKTTEHSGDVNANYESAKKHFAIYKQVFDALYKVDYLQ